MDATEQLQVVGLAREFAEGEIRPHVEAWEHAGALPEDFLVSLAETGFLGSTIPDAFDGLGLEYATYVEILSALAWGDPSVALTIAVHEVAARHVVHHGTDAVRQAWVPRCLGEVLLTYALHEPGAGADVSALETRIDAGGVTGSKDWVTNGRRADRVLVFGTEGGEQVSALVEPGSAGYATHAIAEPMGLRASETVRLTLDGVRVEDGAVVGRSTTGHDRPSRTLLHLSLAAIANGIGRAALEHATRYAGEREQFGRALTGFGAIRAKLGDMGARLNASESLTRAAADALQGVESGGGHTSVVALTASAKLIASETALFVADEAIQIFGGYGYMRDYPVEKLMRDAFGTAVLGGSSDAMRSSVAAEILAAADT